MNFIQKMKMRLVSRLIEKQKRDNPFDVNFSDPYELPPDADSWQNNSHYFTAHSFAGKECFFFRCGLRGRGGRDEVWFMFRDALGEVYLAEKDHYEKSTGFPASVRCVEAGKILEFSYKGPMRRAKQGENGFIPDLEGPRLDADFNARFEGLTEIYEFSRHGATESTARALAQEKFSGEFQDTLKKMHQVHYEQSGAVSGLATIGGKTTVFDKLAGFRDHSYGYRDWDYMDRHIWLVGVLENGDFFHTSLVRYPALRFLQAGFYKTGGRTIPLVSATPMKDFPAPGKCPGELAWEAVYVDGSKRQFRTKLDFAAAFNFGNAYSCFEGVSAYTVDGRPGRGITEFGYNGDTSRWMNRGGK
jgi:hypothetical protein